MHRFIPLLLLALIAGCGRPKQQLNILTWPNGFDPKVVAAFERQFHCKVVLDYFNDEASAIPKLASGGAAVYDIVNLGNHSLRAATNLNILAPLRHENLPNFKNLAPEFINLEFDPGNRFSIPYEWITTGLFARVPPGTALEESWALIFDPAKQPGSFVMVDEITSSLGAALRYKGFSVNTTNLSELTVARDLLIAAKNRSLGFQAGSGTKDRVLNREAMLAMVWNPRTADYMKEDPNLVFFIPREGAAYGIDSLCITSKAPHRELAEAFLNYLLDPHVALHTARYTGSPTFNKGARELLPPDERNNPRVYFPHEVMQRLELNKDPGEMAMLRNELWTQIKAK